MPVSTSSLPGPLPTNLRILLWDIDGTLIRALRRGAVKVHTIPMLEDVSGTAGTLAIMQGSGTTDLLLVTGALLHVACTHEHIRQRIDPLRESYMAAMHKATGNGQEF